MKGPTVLTEFKGYIYGECFVDLSQVVALETIARQPRQGGHGTKIHLKGGQTVVVKEDIHAIKESI